MRPVRHTVKFPIYVLNTTIYVQLEAGKSWKGKVPTCPKRLLEDLPASSQSVR